MKRLFWLIIAIVIIATILGAAYAVILVTQNTPTIPIKTPATSTGIVALCSSLLEVSSNVPSNTITYQPLSLQYTTNFQSLSAYIHCSSGSSLNVTVAGTYIPSFSLPYGSGWLLTGLEIDCSPSTATNACYGISGFSATVLSGHAISLSTGTYDYGIGIQLFAYQSGFSTSIPSFSITWSSVS